MKLIVPSAAWLLLSQANATFLSSGGYRNDHNVRRFASTADDLPDIVKAYRRADGASKSNPTNSLPDYLEPKVPDVPTVDNALSMPEVPPVIDAVPDISAIPDAVSDAADAATTATTSMVDEFVQAVDNTVGAMNLPGSNNPLRALFGAVDGWKSSIAQEQAAIQAKQAALLAAEQITVPIEPAKAPTLFQYLTGAGRKAAETTAQNPEGAATAKAKVGLMVSNAYHMAGQEAPSAAENAIRSSVDSVAANANNLEGLKTVNLAENLAGAGPIGWLAAGAALLVAAGQRQAGEAEARRQMEDLIMKEAAAVKELATELKTMSSEIKKLNGDTADLRKRLKATTAELTTKELEISHQRLKVADKELQMQRQVDKYKRKATINESKSLELEAQLKETIQVKRALVSATEKVKEMERELRAARGEPEYEPELEPLLVDDEPELVAKVNGETVTVLQTPPKPKKRNASKRKAVKDSEVTEKVAVKKSVAKKQSVPKGSKSKKQTPVEVTELKEDWNVLSDSALKRKTVAQLKVYLEARGVGTVDESGKDMKKAVLLDAVRSG